MITLYNVVSIDRYIADKDGSEDFIPDNIWNDFLELCNKYEVVVFGKITYNTIQNFDKRLVSSFENLPIKKVIITRDINFKPRDGYITLTSPEKVIEKFSNILLTSGPNLNTVFLKKKLIDMIILNKIPITLGSGIPQFEKDTIINLKRISTVDLNSKLEVYKVIY